MPVRYRLFPIVFLIAAVAPAAADPVTLVSASRFVQTTATSACCGTTNVHVDDLDILGLSAVPPLEPNPSAAGSALLTSGIMESQRFFYGSGTVSSQVMAPGGEGTAQSYYRVTLDLSQPQNYTFIGVFGTTRLNDGDTTSWLASITDARAADTPIFAIRGSDAINRFHPGTLQPGRYDFLVSFAAISTLPGGVATGFGDFRLEFSDVPPAPTPEPASLLLLGSGAAVLFVRRRMR